MASSKWNLHKFYYRDAYIRNFLPDTALLNQESLKQFLDKYDSVYIKPDRRHGGNGVIRARKSENGYSFTAIAGRKAENESDIPTVQELYRKIAKRAIDDNYIIQQAIPLAVINGRPYDIRSMMMRKPGGLWRFYGYFAKVAGTVSIITNVCRSGGYVITIEEALRKSLGLTQEQIKQKKESMLDLSLKICNRFKKYKASTTQIGIDFALDDKGEIWIIEVNFDLPDHSGNAFAELPDKTNYLRIRRMKRWLRSIRRKRIIARRRKKK
ncbi:YheC/YheD family protein [Paenibacillus arenilitoris]|uniref:YheC/YheD family protein n=1 Tax=Paenibacillus arenilitoris TaxID=2772299 RepID=A0A927H6W4_9BACL|nr:YheC/YheD family protein [Paenibacillus arenilitoris]MBD2870003.1 YheC/YheD family protein [Paenibacillus arenilitoris]